jgi:hypothetical protein
MVYVMITELIGVLSGVLKPFEVGAPHVDNPEEADAPKVEKLG